MHIGIQTSLVSRYIFRASIEMIQVKIENAGRFGKQKFEKCKIINNKWTNVSKEGPD